MQGNEHITRNLVNKIAILNPYLQGGHVQIAETESATRYIDAARNLGIVAEMFSNSDDIDLFKPDIVVAITYQEGKLTKYPTYVSLNAPPSLIKNEERFLRNILSFDGYLTLSTHMIDWLEKVCQKYSKPFFFAKAAFSVPKTKFFECDFSKATAMYMGTNWDGNRHANFFTALDGSGYLMCYGPENSWKNYSHGLYGGQIPFDGVSVINRYQSHGIGLAIGHPVFDAEGIPNNRLFEIPAASALVICGDNALARKWYGDAALVLDHQLNQSGYTEQFISYVEWVRANPKIAAEMAHETHRIYNSKLCMEQHILNLIELHTAVMREKYDVNSSANINVQNPVYLIMPKISSFEEYKILLDDIKNQTASNIILCFHDIEGEYKKFIEEHFLDSKKHYIKFFQDIFELELYLKNIDNQKYHPWVACLDVNVRLFSNHIATCLNAASRNMKNGYSFDIVKARYVEQSNLFHLPDYIQDVHKIYDENNLRLENHAQNARHPRSVFMFKLIILESFSLKFLLSNNLLPINFLKSFSFTTNEEVTSQVNVDDLASFEGYKSLNRLIEKLSSATDKSLVSYIKKLKETIYLQEKKLNDYSTKKSFSFIRPLKQWAYRLIYSVRSDSV